MSSKAASHVLLGYEVGTGKPIEVPIRNMVVTGQTQESGKTTTLEALVARSGVTALTFITKPGESSFASGRRIQPYFRDRADWQFVDQLLAAQLGEKNKFLRSWIIKICRETKTLADVQREVRRALVKATGFNEGIYTQLDAYLELIVPEIEGADLADRLDLQPGLNVMDVTDFRTPMQMLFVQSALDWVNERCRDTVVVIPEAWEFVPQSKGSPVKASAEKLVRRGSGIGNRIWVDSQDTAGIDNLILRGCPVWLIGVQRQIDEIKRNLANIPAGLLKPKAAEIALLELGQYFACFGKTTVKVYVRPAWMDDETARAIALGQTSADEIEAPRRSLPAPEKPPEEDEVDKATAEALTAENARLKQEVADAEKRGIDIGYDRAVRDSASWHVPPLHRIADRLREAAKDVEAEIGTANTLWAEGYTPDALKKFARDLELATNVADRPADAPAGSPAQPHAVPSAAQSPSATLRAAPGISLSMLAPLVRSYPLPLDLQKWALFAGVAPGTARSGPWRGKARALADAGYIEKVGDKTKATPAGVEASGETPANPKDEVALYAIWRSEIANEVGDAAIALLRVLAIHRRFRLTNEQLAILAGKADGTAKSGPWRGQLASLREWGLIDGERAFLITDKGRAIVPDEGNAAPRSDTAEAIRLGRYARLETSKRHYDTLDRPMTREQLGQKLGLSEGTMKSGPWRGAIKEMIENKLVSEDGGELHRIDEELEAA